MHERTLVAALVRQIERIAAEHDSKRVTAVTVSVGEFSGVEPDLLHDAFTELTAATVAQDSEFTLNRVALEAQCEGCGAQFAVRKFCFECPACQSRRVVAVRGEDFILDTVTMEHDDETR